MAISMPLPADVLQIVCEQLGERQDFGTLFNCCLAGRQNSLSELAIESMYRIHTKSPVVAGDDTDLTSHGTSWDARTKEQKKNIAMWALQWRSIIQSSLQSTFYPYCLYIRSLDLGNLDDLLNEQVFRESLSESFFAGDMAELLKVDGPPAKKKTRSNKNVTYQRLNVELVLHAVGESITSFLTNAATTKRADVALENLAGHISSASLQSWTSQLSKLKSLSLFDGAVLNQKVAGALNVRCFDFDDLTFFSCQGANASDIDRDLASFFNELRNNTLRSFNAINARNVGPETLLSLNSHCVTLRSLKLSGLEFESIKNLSYLQGCKALETLEITDNQGVINLEATQNDVFVEVVAWLCGCHNLKELSLKNLPSAPSILEQVCLHNSIKLRDLEVEGYSLANNAAFHRAISHQTSLESLKLKADPEDSFRDDIDTLVSSLCLLKNLKILNLVSTSDYFRTAEINQLASNLFNLEEFWFGGYEVNDQLWPPLSKLVKLKSLNVHALSTFTANGIMNYISTLDNSRQGFLLSVMNQGLEHNLSEGDLALIRQSLKTQVDGQLDFVLFRDYDSTDESFSD